MCVQSESSSFFLIFHIQTLYSGQMTLDRFVAHLINTLRTTLKKLKRENLLLYFLLRMFCGFRKISSLIPRTNFYSELNETQSESLFI